MKKLLIIFVALTTIINVGIGQDKNEDFKSETAEILLIRTDHGYPKNYNVEIEKAIQEIVAFNPEVFITEYIAKDQLVSQKIAYGDYFSKLLKNFKPDLKSDISIDVKTDEYVQKMEEIKSFAHNLDRVNLAYNTFQLFEKLDKEELEVKTRISKNLELNYISLDTLKKYTRYKQRNEYQLIAFPSAVKLELDTLYSMDDQTDSDAFHRHWYYSNDGYSNEEATSYFSKLDSLEEIVMESNEYIKALNSPAYDEVDFYVYDFPKRFSENKYSAKMYEKFWDMRNVRMVENTIQIIENNNAKSAAIIVGASHGRLMKQYLEMAGYNVKDIFQK